MTFHRICKIIILLSSLSLILFASKLEESKSDLFSDSLMTDSIKFDIRVIVDTIIKDAPSQKSTEENKSGVFEGFLINKSIDVDETGFFKTIKILFLFSDVKFFSMLDYYDSTNNSIILEFYNSIVKENAIDQINEFPIVKTDIKQYKIDLNKGIDGLKEDVRDVVKITLYTSTIVPYNITQEYGIPTLFYSWRKYPKDEEKKIIKVMFFVLGFTVLILAGIYLRK